MSRTRRKVELSRTVQAKVSDATWDKLVAVANRQDMSVSHVVRRLIVEFTRKAA